ncbi:alpha/beta-hydrolase [Xylariaceae sp. FL1651]|nr:alpha/beta-hydrolase [Xylariaceae sp. FL1651]
MSEEAPPQAVYSLTGDLPPGCPKVEDVFTPDLLAKYKPEIVHYILQTMAPGRPPAAHQVPLAEVRSNPARFAGPWQKDVMGHERVADHEIVSEDGAKVPVKVYHPDPAKFGAGPYGMHLNFHGGGFVFGDLTSESHICLSMCEGAGVVVIDVNYRHCPEAIFGKCFQDGWAALQWARSSAASLNIKPDSISIGGVSAGGHISIVLQRMARDARIPLRICMATVPPSTSCLQYKTYEESPFKSFREFAHGPVLPWARLTYFGKHCYPPERMDEIRRLNAPWQLAPLEAEDWNGMCPTFIRTAEVDPLRDEGEAYGMKLVEGGNTVTIKRYLGCPHMFMFYQWLPEKQQYDRESIAALKEAHGTQ